VSGLDRIHESVYLSIYRSVPEVTPSAGLVDFSFLFFFFSVVGFTRGREDVSDSHRIHDSVYL